MNTLRQRAWEWACRGPREEEDGDLKACPFRKASTVRVLGEEGGSL